jgi:mRNA interferase HigB
VLFDRRDVALTIFTIMVILSQVQIVGVNKMEKFAKKHAAAKSPLEHWRGATASASWKNPAELKVTFGSASIVDLETIFNIAGNKYRLIALVDYAAQAVVVRDVLTHAEYDRR